MLDLEQREDSMVKIESKIVGYSVVKDEVKIPQPVLIERPEITHGRTYKVKSGLSESALYITINHCEVDGVIRPFEIFINSKDMKHFQWVVALTRLISAVFRHGGEVAFLIDELRSVIDPSGGTFHKGKYIPSLVSVIGDVIEQELISLGLHTKDESLKEAAVAMLNEKVKTEKRLQQCPKCMEFALVVMDGCLTCTSCGDSKCS
jgi:ribonucleoside-diphosphate reductase alpha chain